MEAEANDAKNISETRKLFNKTYLENAEQHDDVVLIDSSSDIDVDVLLSEVEKTQKRTFNETKSVFNISLNDLTTSDIVHEEIDLYKKEIEEQQSEWANFLIATANPLQHRKQHGPPAFSFKLGEEQLNFIKQAPDLQHFLQDSIGFSKDANVFVNHQHAEMRDVFNSTMKKFQHICNHKINNKIAETLADL